MPSAVARLLAVWMRVYPRTSALLLILFLGTCTIGTDDGASITYLVAAATALGSVRLRRSLRAPLALDENRAGIAVFAAVVGVLLLQSAEARYSRTLHLADSARLVAIVVAVAAGWLPGAGRRHGRRLRIALWTCVLAGVVLVATLRWPLPTYGARFLWSTLPAIPLYVATVLLCRQRVRWLAVVACCVTAGASSGGDVLPQLGGVLALVVAARVAGAAALTTAADDPQEAEAALILSLQRQPWRGFAALFLAAFILTPGVRSLASPLLPDWFSRGPADFRTELMVSTFGYERFVPDGRALVTLAGIHVVLGGRETSRVAAYVACAAAATFLGYVALTFGGQLTFLPPEVLTRVVLRLVEACVPLLSCLVFAAFVASGARRQPGPGAHAATPLLALAYVVLLVDAELGYRLATPIVPHSLIADGLACTVVWSALFHLLAWHGWRTRDLLRWMWVLTAILTAVCVVWGPVRESTAPVFVFPPLLGLAIWAAGVARRARAICALPSDHPVHVDFGADRESRGRSVAARGTTSSV